MYSTSFVTKETVDSLDINPPYNHPMASVQRNLWSTQMMSSLFDAKKQTAIMRTEKLLDKDIVPGVELQEQWFPTEGQFGIFLSHSHEDIETAKRFAAHVYNFYGVRVFIDSLYWGYVNDLIEILLERYEKSPKKAYYCVNLVHSMLSMALMKMMDKCETVCFLRSDNSVSRKCYNDFTKSSWIYEEVEFANRINKRFPQRKGLSTILNECRSFSEKEFLIEFKTDLSNFVELESEFWRRMRSDSVGRFNDRPIQERLLDRIHKKFIEYYKTNKI